MLILSAVMESFWNMALKKSTGLTDWLVNSIGITFLIIGIFSFKKSLDSISLSIAIVVWSGVSLLFTIGLDVIFFKTKFDLLTGAFMFACIVSIIGLHYAANR